MKGKECLKYSVVQRGLKGVVTVEMSYILPMVLGIFALIMYTVFFYHDKNIIIGAASETAVLGAQLERRPDESAKADMNNFYQQRITGKLILFSETSAEVEISDKTVTVTAEAHKGRMSLSVKQQAPILKPEERIRRKRFLEQLAGGAEEVPE